MIRETPAIRERINQLYEKSNGNLTPDMVIEDARSPDSPLHAQFEWDQGKAAYQHWLDTARELISCVKVEIQTSTREIVAHAYVHTGGSKQGYKAVTRIRDEREQAMEILKQEFQRVADALRRAKEIAIAFDLESEVDRLMTMVGAREVVIIRRAQLTLPGHRPFPRTTKSRRSR